MFPIIAIIGAVDDDKTITLQNAYTAAIENAGAIPVVIPYTDKDEALDFYAELCDGVLFSGGCDIEPKKFGEEKKEKCGNIQLFRDDLEFAFFERIFKMKKPIMGICRGAQIINVALGGTLYQDIPTEYETDMVHRQTGDKTIPSHEVVVTDGTPLMALVGKERMTANTFHHQSIKDLGKDLKVMARADDGIIEAAYYDGDVYMRAYQWHPERLAKNYSDNKLLFDDFIKAVKENKK